MKPDWTALRDSLARYRKAGLDLPIWWRDDDAVSATPALEHLSRLSKTLGVNVYVAVIPGLVEQSLVEFIDSNPNLIPVTHGWRHENHAPPEAKKSEFGTARGDAEDELRTGFATMQTRFGPRFAPLFVPPWNRIDPLYLPALAQVGYTGVSTFTARTQRHPAPGLEQINTHIDPIDWRGTRDLRDPDRLVAELAAQLDRRRRAESDATEPLGYLTHHLVHSDRVWEFSRQLLNELLDGGGTPCAVIPLPETS